MIEIYVLLTLAALGFMMNKTSSNTRVINYKSYALNKTRPSCNNVYQSKNYLDTRNIVEKHAKDMFDKSVDPTKTGVISKNFYDKKEEVKEKKIKSLTGDYVDEKEMFHNNMTPYFGSRIRQNITENANSTLLESFTGVTDVKSKCEVKSMYDTTQNVGNVNGMQSKDDFYRERMVTPRLRNNETPVEKIYVGPGLNKGYSSSPSGGFHDVDSIKYAMPKCVDELRAANKPKVTFEGRTVDGQKSSLRGEIGRFEKNRANTYYEQGHERLFKTTGAYLKASEIPEFNVKETNRLDTSKYYIGTAIQAQGKARVNDPSVALPHKSQLGELGIRNPALNKIGKGEKDDYGKSKIMVYANERDITSTKVYQGNLTSFIKALVAPLQDLVKITRKDDFVDNPRHFGNMGIQIPDKPTTYDPNDVMRTTVKETTIHDAIIGNLKGNEKLTIHDPNDVTRTTVKETTIHDAVLGNLKGNEKLTIYDPNDIARTTIKETLIHDEIGKGTVTGPKQLSVYDPEEIAKKTLRETLERFDYELNLNGPRKATVHDPDDVARTTMKETTEDNDHMGHVDRMEGMGDYNTTEYDARRTHKQFTSDNDYFGVATRSDRDGYKVSKYEAPITQKQFTSDYEYYGNAGDKDKKQMLYDDMYNAEISATKESTLQGREPTQTGAKTYVTGDCISLSHKKQQCDLKTVRETANIDKVRNAIPVLNESTVTKTREEYGQNDRLDASILKAYLDNPYTQPLDSVA